MEEIKLNRDVADAIKKKIRPLMPESAYRYFLKWFNSLVSEDEGKSRGVCACGNRISPADKCEGCSGLTG